MNKLIILVIVIIVAIGGFVMLKQADKNEDTGRVVISVTDAAVDMTNISEITMTVNKVELHSEATGWVTASSATRTYSLLDLKARGESALAADANIAAGTYNQIRVTIDNIQVKTNTGTVSEAKLPSGQLKLNGEIVVNAEEITSVNLDFLASASLHMTGKGMYVFAPVVHMEVRSDVKIGISEDDKDDKDEVEEVEIEDGKIEEEIDAGMDVDGEVKKDFEINANAKVKIENGMIKLED
ncbi:MAG: DUF4382 domain-containing protein [bacterium]|nr:DUF4382 domain-containing protein [bacterium]